MGQDSSPGSERLAAHHAGLSTFRLGANKRPAVSEWRSFMTDPPDEADIVAERARTIGYALVCGLVSSRLVVLDFEASFGRERWRELLRRLDGAGLSDNFANWCSGYTVKTPSGGIHVAVHLAGDGPVDGNAKLAFADGHVIAETRGEGGYVVGPGSNGETHPSGRAWSWAEGSFDDIAWDTPEVFAAVCDVIASFDETPQTTAEQSSTPRRIPLGADSWIERAKGALPPMVEVITHYGATYHHSDPQGDLFTRPGKESRLGHSMRINTNDRLYVWSWGDGVTVQTSEALGDRTFDVIDVEWVYRYNRLPTLDERTDYLRALRPDHPGGEVVGRADAQESGPAVPSVRLDDAFWQSTDWLVAIRTAAWSRGLAPSGVLGALLSTYATTVPMGIWLPAVWGSRAPLNTYCCLVGQSGSGKTTSMRLAADLVGPVNNPDILIGRSLRSGEGLPRLATRPQPKRKRGEEPLDDTPSFRNGVQIHFDEGSALGKQTERVGSMTIPYLNTAWAGDGIVGGTKAGEDAYFPADLVRVCCLIGVQFGAAANLFTGESAALGFPQRLLFFGLKDPSIMDRDRSEMSMGPVQPLGLPSLHASDYARLPCYLGVPDDVVDEIRTWTLNKEHGEGLSNPLDGHMMQLQLRVAGLMAVMSARWAVDHQCWDLARQVCEQSRAIRSQLVAAIGDVSMERARALGRQDVIRDEIRDDAWLTKRSKRVQAYLQMLGDAGASMKEIKSRLDQHERLRRDEIIAYAIARGWVIHRGERFFA
jgi:hypothetical protein